MSVRTPNLQPRSQHHAYWGVFDTESDLPNAASNPLASPEFDKLEPGDVAYCTSTRRRYVLDQAGTASGADAVWYGEASTTAAPMDLYVDGDSGDDNNPGTQAEPLATIVEAESRIPDVVDHLVKVWVQPAASAYTFPTVRDRVMRNSVCVVAAADDGNFHFNELLGSTSAQAGSPDADREIVTSGGLGSNTFRGKVLEVLTGAAAGDRRMIGDHDDTTIEVSMEFSADVVDGDTFRIVEPSVDLNLPAVIDEIAGANVGGDKSAPVLVAGLAIINFRITGDDDFATNGRVYFYGIDIEGLGFHVWRGGGLQRWGCDSSDGLDRDAELGSLFGAPSNTSWRGWSIGGGSGDLWALEDTTLEAVGPVVHGVPCDNAMLLFKTLFTFSTGVRCFGIKGPVHINFDGTWNDVGGEQGSKIKGPVLGFGVRVSRFSLCRFDKVSVEASGGNAIQCEFGGTVYVSNILSISDCDIGILCQNAGRAFFAGGSTTITAAVADTRVVDPAGDTDQSLTAYSSDGDFIAAGDGSLIQRIP